MRTTGASHPWQGGWVIGLAGFAAVAMRQGRPERAGRLFGAAAVVRAGLGYPRWHAHHLEIERNVAVTKTQVDEAAFARAWAEGQAMTLEQAVAHAIDATR